MSSSSINLVPAQAGKVNIGLALHWPCVTDNSGTTTYGLTAIRPEMSTPTRLQWTMAHLSHFTGQHRSLSSMTNGWGTHVDFLVLRWLMTSYRCYKKLS